MPDLPMRQLGRTGLMVTTLGYGAFELRGAARGRDVTPEQADTVLNAVLDAGINFVDTAPDYLYSEEFIGTYISHRRSEYYLATKCGCLMGAAPRPVGEGMPHLYTADNVTESVHQSLRRMKTEYVDLLQFHISPSKHTMEEHGALEAALKLKEQGKTRFLGMSGTLPNILEHMEMRIFDVFQIPYSALERAHEDVITAAAATGAGIVIRGGAAQGGVSAAHRRSDAQDLWQEAQLDELLGGMGRMEFLLRFTISHPALDTTIVGTINPDHLRENLETVRKGPLEPDLYSETKRRLTAAGMAPSPVQV